MVNGVIDITAAEKEAYNAVVNHPLQSFEWGEFRKKTGVTVIRKGIVENEALTEAFTITIHRIPHTPFTVGYLPKGNLPSKKLIQTLKDIAKEHRCIFIQLEPNVIKKNTSKNWYKKYSLRPSFHPLFTQFTFILDISPDEETLLKNMHSKTRYNIRLAQRKGVYVEEDNSEKAFAEYMRLTQETTTRQKFYAHTPTYHKTLWKTLSNDINTKSLTYHLFHARFKDESGKTKTLVSWVLFAFKDMLYYPYGASSSEHRELMASNLIAWEAIRFGRSMQLQQFDMWGALSPDPDKKDPWYGFHRFKEGYGGELTEFVGSFDLVINPALYQAYKVADKLRWILLRLKK